jgi:uncharacterized iron-regulated membrane protein
MKSDFIFKILLHLRRPLFWLHLAAGVVAAAVIVVMSVTGVLLTFQRQITSWADAMPLVAEAGGSTRVPLEQILAAAETGLGIEPSTIVVRSDPRAPVTVTAGRGAPIFVDPYRARVVGQGSARVRSFFHEVTDWHRWLAASGDKREMGRAVTGAANMAFLFIVVSGIYIWGARRWNRRAIATTVVPNLRLSGKARDFNWHHAVGFWTAIPLLVVIPCGIVISYPWATDLVYRAFGEAPPPRRTERVPREGRPPTPSSLSGVDVLLARAEAQVPGWNAITLRLPAPPEGPVTFAIDRGEGVRPDERGQLTLARTTGEVVKWEPYATQSAGRRARAWMRWAHTGEAFGLVGQTAAGLASAGAVVLAWTGLALAWRRLHVWRAARAGVSVPSAPITLDPSIDSGGLP